MATNTSQVGVLATFSFHKNREMDERRDLAVVALVLVALSCLAIFFLKVAHPSGGLVAMLFQQL